MKRVAFVGLFVALVAVSGAPAADPTRVGPRADALDLLLIGGEKPARLELRVEVGGKSVVALWDETFAKLLTFFDRDADGSLNKGEAARLPSAFALRQVLWGQFTAFSGDPPAWTDLDLNGDGAVSRTELTDCYRRAGLGGVQVGVGKPPATDRLTGALEKHLDTNADGKLAEAEWKAASGVLAKLDTNDDELIGPGELVERTAYPGALGSILLTTPAPGAKPDAIIDALPLVVLPIHTADTRWTEVVAARRAKDKLPAVSADALRAAPATAWRAQLGAGKTSVEPVGGKAPANARLMVAFDHLRLELRADEGKLAEQTATARKRFLVAFAEFDADSDGALDTNELANTKAGQFKQLQLLADRDEDGKLQQKELFAWLDLQESIARAHVLLTLLDHGTGLFEPLDADRDGSLSVRELRTAWDRLKAAGCTTDGKLDRTKLVRHLFATVSHGHPRHALGQPVRSGPEWFRAMDRNGDGDVSRREFTGPADVFDKLDLDKDGLLGPGEAEQLKE